MEYIQQLGGLSYLGVFGISLIAMIFLPFPEEIALLAFGYLAATGVFSLPILIPVCMAGLFVADAFVYGLAYHGSKITTKFYQKLFADRFDFLNNLSGERLERVIIFSRFLIYFRFLAGFIAGYYKIGLRKFFQYELVSLSIYVTLFLGLGYFLHNQFERVISGVGIAQHIILVVILACVAIVIFNSMKKYVLRSLESKQAKEQGK